MTSSPDSERGDRPSAEGADTEGGRELHWNVEGASDLPLKLFEGGVHALLDAEGIRAAEISFTFLPDDRAQALNREWLGHDWVPDVLTFPLGQEPLLGDVYIGLHQARRQAAEHGVPEREELLRLVLHAVLHLLGYEHPEEGDRDDTEMYRLQERILSSVLA